MMPCEIDTFRRAARSAAVEEPGIDVRQQAGFVEDEAGHFGEIRQRRLVAEACELFARAAIAKLRLVAEREQRFLAAGVAPGARDRQDLIATT